MRLGMSSEVNGIAIGFGADVSNDVEIIHAFCEFNPFFKNSLAFWNSKLRDTWGANRERERQSETERDRARQRKGEGRERERERVREGES
jgi:hypothetical protein